MKAHENICEGRKLPTDFKLQFKLGRVQVSDCNHADDELMSHRE